MTRAVRVDYSTGEVKLGAECSSRAGGRSDCTNEEQGCRAARPGQDHVQKQIPDQTKSSDHPGRLQ